MNFLPNATLAEYARAAVDLRLRMGEYHASRLSHHWLAAFLEHRTRDYQPGQAADPQAPDRVFDAARQMTSLPWQVGEPYVLAPAMTAIVAAAADALDLTDEVLPEDIAPDNGGVLFLPEPIYQRGANGAVTSLGAITWAHTVNTVTGGRSWFIAGWADHHDPLDPAATRRRQSLKERPDVARQMPPYVLVTLAELPIGRPIEPYPRLLVMDDEEHDWEPAPDGRYCLSDTGKTIGACAAVAYAFWRIQAQPLASVAAAPIDRPARRRAMRAGIKHDTRVVMLRRSSPLTEPGDGNPKWHYRVRFMVKGHWRRLIDPNGRPYRIWIHAHIKGPDGAPLLHGEKVAVLAR
ncbi:hypothetical protein ACIBSW_24880 [Actinoplanes sp. NPDC049668]|uniref:hypothetical protein n=1 Tax=unclassified Actinoplanes TaxID=2626549 RepID=UPI0033A28FB2